MNIIKPTLLVDKKKCIDNIEFMVNKAMHNNVILRPHFKTHQSAEIGNWFREFGITSITVSSVSMAKYFAENGWNDITIAFPVNILEIDDINFLAEKIKLNLLVESPESVKFLTGAIKFSLGIFIKIDTGYHRTGIQPENIELVDQLIYEIKKSSKLFIKGFLSHSGNTYKAASISEIEFIHKNSLSEMNRLKQIYKMNFPELIISIGDTPSCSLMNDFTGIDEIRPGNFVFYDVMQNNIGSCSVNQIAVALAVPVVAVHKDRNEIVVYGGAVHLSKDYVIDKHGNKIFGYVVKFNNDSWSAQIERTYVSSLSQEHGIIKTTPDIILQTQPGNLFGILPVHSCLSADLMRSFVTTGGGKFFLMDKK